MSQRPVRKSSLSDEAIIALGMVSPELAWLQLRDSFMGAILDSPATVRELAEWEGLANSQFGTQGLESLAASMKNPEYFPPVSTINHLLESNPNLSLRDIPHLPPLTVLKAILHMVMTNEAYL
jgi:hypothetical protein